jgi:hypothetical protein
MKQVFLVAVVFTTTQTVFGQSFFGSVFSKLSYGIKAGGNYSNFTSSNFGAEGLAGFHAGAVINFRLTNNLSIQEDFLFSTQGAKTENQNIFGKEDLKLSYLSIPIVLKYHTKIGIYAEVGGQANMLVSDVKNTGFDNFANKIDAGAVGGIGYQFRTTLFKGLGIGARYYQGFTDVGKFNSTTVKSDFKNGVAQLSVFYVF